MSHSQRFQFSNSMMTSSSKPVDSQCLLHSRSPIQKKERKRKENQSWPSAGNKVPSYLTPQQPGLVQPQPHYQYEPQPYFNQTLPQAQAPYWSKSDEYPGFQNLAPHQAIGNYDWTKDPLQWTSNQTPQNVHSASSMTTFSLFSALSSHPSVKSPFKVTPPLSCLEPPLVLTTPPEASKDEIIADIYKAIGVERRRADMLISMLLQVRYQAEHPAG
jgi:hypothetical protein